MYPFIDESIDSGQLSNSLKVTLGCGCGTEFIVSQLGNELDLFIPNHIVLPFSLWIGNRCKKFQPRKKHFEARVKATMK